MKKSVVFNNQFTPKLGGQFELESGGQFALELVVNLHWKVVVNLTGFSTTVANDIYFANYGGDIYKLTGGTGSLVPLGQTSRNWMGMCAVGSDIYAAVKGGDVYKMTGGTGNFIALGVTSRNWTGLAVSNTGDIYGCTDGPIYKRVGGAGDFILYSTVIALSITITPNNDLYTGSYQQGSYKQIGLTGAFVSTVNLGATWGLSSLPNLNVYAAFTNGIYMQTNFAEGSPNLNGGKLKLVASGGKGGGTSRLEFFTGLKTGVATNMQTKILREYIDENGYHIYTSIPVHEDNAAALTAGLPIGCEYRTSTGIKMIVY